ncbi:hypothetical protein CI102_10239 [Trichoderma harzianum]|uniref:2EXR domain-containing protein n=1 Tax=Trichoderma harzianum CBS 226.95 TaxID=983964 RepID=A0A2T4A7P8_TRIHA|nr:hypothetical protein M431DRAFT_89403 [Trichoderma harzianum CBS 226.95]PKK44087.1 hypothetical protein CI102_10239 [Trichoderma harzianum]PTB53099.1 hypothetical protein M431DRAFT_89403 [Trichoderma harzianum CBS 226.95]
MESHVCQFLDLPFELRLMIWKLVLRPLDHNRPGAHFFSVVNRADGVEARRLSARCPIYADNNHCSGYHLAAPKFDSNDGGHSWTKNNPSAYAWDFGMWTACRESRQIIKAHYGKEDWTTRTRRSSSSRPSMYSYNQSCISLTTSGNGEKWRFRIHPKQDLVCLQAFDPSTISWWENDDGGDICVAMNAYNHFHFPKLFRFGHVAIAYDPSWYNTDEENDNFNFGHLYAEQSARGFFIRTLATIDDCVHCFGGNDKHKALWLIDYNLKRVRYCNKSSKERKVFYGNGQNFMEVEYWLSRKTFSSGRYTSAFDFLDKLYRLLEGDRPCHYIHHRIGATGCNVCRGNDYNPRSYLIYRQVRVLMCEEST